MGKFVILKYFTEGRHLRGEGYVDPKDCEVNPKKQSVYFHDLTENMFRFRKSAFFLNTFLGLDDLFKCNMYDF